MRIVAWSAIAGIAFLAAARPAWADGMTGSLKDAPPPVAEGYVWDGLYVGVGVGYGSFDHNGSVTTSKTKQVEKKEKEKVCKEYDYYGKCKKYGFEWGDWVPYGDPHVFSETFGFGDDEWNLFGTMQIGFDRLIRNHFLIGVFADFDFYDDAESNFTEKWIKSYYGYDADIATITGKLTLDDVWSVGGRFGVLLTPRILVYGVGGYTEASLKGGIDVTFNYGPTLHLSAPDDLQGYFAGGGIELKVQRNVSFKFEYRYADYDGGGGSASAGPFYSPAFCSDYHYGKCKEKKRFSKSYGSDFDFDSEVHSVRAALVLKLGEPERPITPLK